jgi:hypothetical protein
MQPVVRVGGLGVAFSLVLLTASADDAEAAKRITGKLDKPGYTVIALAANGKAKSVVARRGQFRVKPRAKRVTLQLRTPDGVYAGPIVIRRSRRRAILGVKVGARLGRITIRPGYARPARRLSWRWVDATFAARARKGIPIGAGVFGRVRSEPPRSHPPGDRDRDGIPDPLDVDDDGDLILDNIDRSRAARASQFEEFMINSLMGVGQFDPLVNANAGGLTSEQVDAALSRAGILKLEFVRGDSAELDCGSPQSRRDPNVGGLVYCSRGGTGKVAPPLSQPFPECCDPDGDGFGTFQPQPDLQGGPMVLNHGATTAQIGTGDVLIERLTTGGVETQLPASVQYIFATVPALVSYSDGQGNSATISYPVPDGTFFPVAAGPNGDVIVTMTLWRPQRRPIAGEACLGNAPPCEWIDMGHLDYGIQSAGKGGCPQNDLSESDPNLKKGSHPSNFGQNSGFFTDLASDQPANPANTFTYTVNLTRCLSAFGLSFNPGEIRKFSLGGATSGGDGTFQAVVFRRQ